MSGSGILEAPATESARRIALRHLDSAAEALRRMRSGGDEEGLHDFRVSLRRLRTILKAFKPVLAPEVRKKDRRVIRKLAVSTGAGRDAEVQLAWLNSIRDQLAPSEGPMIDRLATELRAERDAEYRGVLEKAGPRFKKLEKRLRGRLETLELPPEPSAPGAGRSLAWVLNGLLPGYAEALSQAVDAIRTPDDRQAIHAARIRGKRLRYLVESLAGEVGEVDDLLTRLKALQDALGDLRDAQLLELRVRASDLGTASDEGAVRPGEAELGALLIEEQKARFADFEAGWRGEGTAAYQALIAAMRHRVAAATPDMIEIERKYLLSGPPDRVNGRSAREIEQGYLPGERIQERLRRIVDADRIVHVRSIKLGSGLVRTEVQEQIEPELFEKLWPLTEGRRVLKKRYRFAYGGLVWEIDGFTDRDLWLAEVELPSADHEATPPEWLERHIVREVTDEPEYLNVNLAR